MSDQSHENHGASNQGSHYQPALGVMLFIIALFIAGTFLMLRSSSPSTSSPTTVATLPTGSTTTLHTTTTVSKAKVRVQVANGTLTTGLARHFKDKLLTLGWLTLPEVNGPRVLSTVVYYNPGFVWAARQIASAIGAGPRSVQPLNGARPVPGAASDDVIVILGPDVAILG